MDKNQFPLNFRRRQAISDLAHHASRVDPEIWARIARAAPGRASAMLRLATARNPGPPDAPTAEALRLAAALPGADYPAFLAATALLLLADLRGDTPDPDAAARWGAVADQYRAAPPTWRAALMNALDHVEGMDTVDGPAPEDRLSVPRAAIIGSLRRLLDGPGGKWRGSRVEVAIVAETPNHPRFGIANATGLLRALSRREVGQPFHRRWEESSATYLALPSPEREAVIAAVRHLYEQQPRFGARSGAPSSAPLPVLAVGRRPAGIAD